MKSRWRSSGLFPAAVAILVLHTSLVDAVSLTGCSSLNTGSFGGTSSSSSYMSNGKCSDSCNGYAFAITQDQNCWCSNEASGDTTSVGDCNSPCPGYPYELCGNKGQSLFGYIALGKAPIGTQGGSSSAPAPKSSSQEYSAPPSSSPDPTTVEKTSVVVSVSTAQPSTDTDTDIAIATATPPTSAVTVVKTTSISASSSSHSTHKWTPVTSTALVTVSGAIVTQVVTSTPTADPLPQESLPKQSHSGLSNGAVAGATIGAIVGVALIGALAFLCWRRRRSNAGDAEGALSRNPSVLSRTGLLGSARGDRSAGGDEAVAGASTLPTLPRIQTMNQPLGLDPGSAATGNSTEMFENKRSSRPMFVDSRLNPNPLMNHPNLSRTSIGTLQDNQDYSRPLEVRNPD